MIYFILTLILFSSLEVISKPLMNEMDPFLFNFIRFAGALLFLFPIFLKKGKLHTLISLSTKEKLYLAVLGILNIVFSMAMLQLAVKETNASTVVAIFCSNPIFVLLFSTITRSEKLSFRKMIAFMFGIVGISIIFNVSSLAIEKGVLYAFVASVSFALYTFLSKKSIAKSGVLTTTVSTFFSGTLISAIIIIFAPVDFFSNTNMNYTFSNILIIIYSSILVTGVGYLTFFKAIEKYSPSSASTLFFIKPLLATLLAAIILNEKIELSFIVGLFFILMSSALLKKRFFTIMN